MDDKRDPLYPAMRWDKEGNVRKVNSAAEDDPELLPYHPEDPRGKIKDAAANLQRMAQQELAESNVGQQEDKPKPPVDLTDEEVVKALQAGGVSYPPGADPNALRALLISSVTSALAQKGKTPPVGANAKLLLEILQQG